MQFVFYAVAVAGISYFSFAKRRFDLFSLAFYSACVYFLPGFFGYTNDYASGNGVGAGQVALISETYVVFVMVMTAILLAAVAFDRLARSATPTTWFRGGDSAAAWAAGLGVLGFIVSLGTTGEALLDSSKSAMMAELNLSHTLWTVGASLGAVLSFASRRWLLFAVCAILLLVDLYVGFRMSIATTAAAVFTLGLSDAGRQRLVLRSWKVVAAGMVAVLTLFIYKQFYIVIKAGLWNKFAERVVDPKDYSVAVARSEPFITQAILNRVLESDFRIGAGHLVDSASVILPFSRVFTGPVESFNAAFQPALFPEARSGLANNIWAEMWSSGGWVMLVTFVVFFVLSLALGTYLLRSPNRVLVGGVALLFSYWSFYIHRNDLLFQFSMLEKLLFFWVVCVLLSIASGFVIRKLQPRYEAGKQNSSQDRVI